jgi:hypothetical protein
MTQTTDHPDLKTAKLPHHEDPKHMSNFDMVATGVATGIIATAIMETGRGMVSLLAKNPLVIFSAGLATGYFVRKYRKGIILSANKLTNQGKDFAARRKKHIDDLLTSEDDLT